MNFKERSLPLRVIALVYAIFVFGVSFFIRSKREKVVFGGFAMIKYARWAAALNSIDIESVTLVPSVMPINTKSDWDLTWLDTTPSWISNNGLRRILAPATSWFWVVRNARVICSPVGGISFYGWLGLDKLELWFLKYRGIHTVCVCGGGDAYALGNIRNSSLRHALQSSYPERSRMHIEVERSVRIWEQKADIFIADKMILDGIARSDLISPHVGVVDTEHLATFHSNSIGILRNDSSPVRIIHAPNHRYFKGTEYICKAISDLRNKGHNIDFVLIENMETNLVLNEIANSDIVIDQIIMPGYANFAIESMALGKPVVCNLEMPEFRELMTRYSFLNQCPAVSSSPETLMDVIEKLILDQKLRDELGQLGINFSKKYHSFSAWQKLWNEFEIENFDGVKLSKKNLFHPLNKDFLAE